MEKYKIVTVDEKVNIWKRLKEYLCALNKQYEEKREKRYVESALLSRTRKNYSKF